MLVQGVVVMVFNISLLTRVSFLLLQLPFCTGFMLKKGVANLNSLRLQRRTRNTSARCNLRCWSWSPSMHSSRKSSNVVCHCSIFVEVLLCTIACLLLLFEVDEQEAGALGTERQQDAL